MSEKSLHDLFEGQSLGFEVKLTSKKHNDFKPETENLEGPGQFLRHYSPNIESFLFTGEFKTQAVPLSECVLIDYGSLLQHL